MADSINLDTVCELIRNSDYSTGHQDKITSELVGYIVNGILNKMHPTQQAKFIEAITRANDDNQTPNLTKFCTDISRSLKATFEGLGETATLDPKDLFEYFFESYVMDLSNCYKALDDSKIQADKLASGPNSPANPLSLTNVLTAQMALYNVLHLQVLKQGYPLRENSKLIDNSTTILSMLLKESAKHKGAVINESNKPKSIKPVVQRAMAEFSGKLAINIGNDAVAANELKELMKKVAPFLKQLRLVSTEGGVEYLQQKDQIVNHLEQQVLLLKNKCPQLYKATKPKSLPQENVQIREQFTPQNKRKREASGNERHKRARHHSPVIGGKLNVDGQKVDITEAINQQAEIEEPKHRAPKRK